MKGFAGLFFLLLSPCWAQQPELHYQTYTLEDGLSQSTVNCILQDRLGFMWFGTLDGLNRFDGYEFKIFQHDPENARSISHHDIRALVEDKDGFIWIGTFGGGLNKFDPSRNEFQSFRGDSKREGSLRNDAILSLMVDRSGHLWVGDLNSVALLSDTKDRFQHYPLPIKDDYHVMSILEDSQDRIWVGTDERGLFVLDRHSGRYSPITKELGKLSILDMHEDRAGRFWVGTDQGLFLLDRERGRLLAYDTTATSAKSPKTIGNILEDHHGGLWFGIWDEGLKWLRPDGGEQLFKHEPNSSNSLGDNQINSLYQDRTGMIWIGTDNAGLSVTNPRESDRFAHYRTAGDDPSNPSPMVVWSIFQDHLGVSWVGTSNGLHRFEGNQSQRLTKQPDRNSLSSDKIRSIHEDADGILWFGTHQGGLNRYDRKTFTHFTHDPQNTKTLSHDVITCITSDREKNLWVGTEHGLNLRHANGFTRFMPGDGNHLSNGHISALLEDRQGRFWIGTLGGGLNLFDRRANSFKTYPISGGNHAGNVTSICESTIGTEQTLWLGTYGRGLYKFDPQTGNSRAFLKKDGLPNEVVYGVLCDQRGNLWMSTNRGLAFFDTRREVFRNYTTADGIQSNEFNRGAYFKSDSGEMFFGGINGYNSFMPMQIVDDPVTPELVLTDLLFFNKSVPLSTESQPTPLDRNISHMEELELTHENKMVSFVFSGLHFRNPQKNQYSYLLENHDEDWISADATHRRATYTDLKPGSYIFRVKGTNADGVWNESGTSLSMRVKPPIWATLWAKASYVLVLIIILLSIIRSFRLKLKHQEFLMEQEHQIATQATLMAEKDRRLAAQERRSADNLREFNRTLDLKVSMRTKELEEKNKENLHNRKQLEEQALKLQAQTRKLLEMNELKTSFFTNISHELRTPLALIIGPLENNSPALGEQGKIMLRNAQRLMELINQLLDVSKLEAGGMVLEPHLLDLVPFIQTRVHVFSSIAESRHLNLSFIADVDRLLLRFDPDKMEKVIYNLLSNAFKFTRENGKILVRIYAEDDWACVSVKDTGIGIPPEQLNHVFDRFYQGSDPVNNLSASSGVGLALARELIQLHGGTIKVYSEYGFGSEFTLKLPHPEVEGMVEEIPEPKFLPLETMPVQETEPETIADKKGTSKPKIVIIEDHPDMRTYLNGLLAEEYTIVLTNDGEEGIHAVWETSPDLVISDVMMPRIDGFEVCRLLKKDKRSAHIPILLLSARSSQESRQEGWETGADAYLTKPFNASEFRSMVVNLIQSRKKLRHSFADRVVMSVSEIAATPEDEAFLQKAEQVLERHYQNCNFGVFELAEELNLSRRQLLRKLTAITGRGPADFIRDFRLYRAGQFLKKNVGNVTEIAYKVGFKNAAHFSSRFRDLFGVPPKEYAEATDLEEE